MYKRQLLNSTEILPTILSILRSYSLYAPELFSNKISLELFRVLAGYLPKMRDDAFAVFVSLLDILLLENSSNESFINNLLTSGLFSAMIDYVLDDNQSIILCTKIYLVLSRLAKNSPEVFFRMLDIASVDVEKFFKTWLQYYNNNGNPRNKKVNLMALLSLTAYGVPKNIKVALEILAEVVKRTFYFLEEIKENDNGSCEAYNLDFTYEDIDDYAYLDPDIKPHGEKNRYGLLLEKMDPVYKTNLLEYLKETIMSLKTQLLNSDFNQLMSLNDGYTLDKLHALT